jgi:hypothetical protein
MKTLIMSALVGALASCGGKSSPGGTGPDKNPPPGGADAAPATPAAADAGVAEAPPPDAAPPPDPKVALRAAETDAYTAANPVFDKYCTSCHSRDGDLSSKKALEHLDITSYPFGGHHVTTIGPTIAHVLGIDGAKPKMPRNKPGAVQGDDLAKIKAWAAAWQAADDGGAHE